MSKVLAFALRSAICLPVFGALIWYSDQMGYRRGYAKGLAEAPPAPVTRSVNESAAAIRKISPRSDIATDRHGHVGVRDPGLVITFPLDLAFVPGSTIDEPEHPITGHIVCPIDESGLCRYWAGEKWVTVPRFAQSVK